MFEVGFRSELARLLVIPESRVKEPCKNYESANSHSSPIQSANKTMDFFECWFHWSFDGGSGVIEEVLMIAITVSTLVLVDRVRLGATMPRWLRRFPDKQQAIRRIMT
jgi:hypothetical protein